MQTTICVIFSVLHHKKAFQSQKHGFPKVLGPFSFLDIYKCPFFETLSTLWKKDIPEDFPEKWKEMEFSGFNI